MNDAVTSCIMVLRSVVQHLERNGKKLVRLDNCDLSESLKPYATTLGIYFGKMTDEERKRYRDLRGVQGQTTRMRRAQQALRSEFPNFDPVGLQDFLHREKQQTNLRAKAIIDRLEQILQLSFKSLNKNFLTTARAGGHRVYRGRSVLRSPSASRATTTSGEPGRLILI